ncbi:MAG: undecaprenyl-diphosphate phosphatase [Calothrix sp. SM1_5_4]|nr:undecaprenyl-diphosphate phosphatase [Calothrix sp. SM1_5_4]
MNTTQSLILAVVEGLTEYLPVSSTGHIILASWMMGINQEPFVKDFTVMVQFGAILSVLLLYWRRFLLNFRIYPKIAVAFLPAAVLGLAVKKHIDAILGDVAVVGWALLIGGVLLVLTDHWVRRLQVKVCEVEELPLRSCLEIGIFQCLAFVPGVSRAAATIWGGLYKGMSLQMATEFSFFLAVPTLAGASFLKLLKVWPSLTAEQVESLLFGNVVSFIVGAIAIRFFVRLVTRFGLRHFGYYRIVLGAIVLIVVALGHQIDYL